MVIKRFLLTFLLFLLTLSSVAQTLQEGRNLFSQGKYEQAMPIIGRYLKQQPENASRNYWYGVCLYETGRKDECLPYLQKAAKKKIIKAYRYLSMYYADHFQYPEAIDCMEKLIAGMSADAELHNDALESQYEEEAERLRKAYRMLRATQKICFIDSCVVSKHKFLSNYMLDSSIGSIGSYSGTFGGNTEGDVFIPETGSEIYFSRFDTDSIFRLYHGYRSFDEWTDIAPVNAGSGDIRYPFVMSDGMTVYFASNGSESIGGYDIFATRVNSETGGFLLPENIGMPFNSEANDYMYVIDEANGLGWFATDRRQPSDSVCIYTFIPNESHFRYNLENGDTAMIIRAARIASIAESQTDPDAVRRARQRLTMLAFTKSETAAEGPSLTFVIDDFTDYHSASDFRSPDAKRMFNEMLNAQKSLKVESAKLQKQRELWSKSKLPDRERMRPDIRKLEQEVAELEKRIASLELQARNTEVLYLTR